MKKVALFLCVITAVVFIVGRADAALIGIGEAVVYDDTTERYWTISTTLFGGGQYSFQDAQTLASASTYYGFDDWQIPTYSMYQGLVTNFGANGTTPFLSLPLSYVDVGKIYFGRWYDGDNGKNVLITWEAGDTPGHVFWQAEIPLAQGYPSYVWMVSSGHEVPVPGAVWLLGSGLICLVGLRKKLKK